MILARQYFVGFIFAILTGKHEKRALNLLI